MSIKAIFWGAAFGLIIPLVGLFLGLQVSVAVGSVFAFPIVLVAILTGTPFATWSASYFIGAFALSAVIWAMVFGIAAKLFNRG